MFGIFGNIGKHFYLNTQQPQLVYSVSEPLFTQAELQQLKVVLAEAYNEEERVRIESKMFLKNNSPCQLTKEEEIYLQKRCTKRKKLLANLLSKVKKELT